MKPMKTDFFKMNVHVNSDFLGIYEKEQRTDPDNVRSRTDHVVSLNDCSTVWKSASQDEMSTSAMMAEYCALSTAMRDVLSLRTSVEAVANECELNNECLTTFQITVWKDNMGASTLANLNPEQMTSRSRFCDFKVHWFRSHLKPKLITVSKIDTKRQIADLFAKPSLKEQFEYLRKLLMSW